MSVSFETQKSMTYGSRKLETTGNSEAESRALANLYYVFLDLEHLGVSNERIARNILQDTPNAKNIALAILGMKEVPIKGYVNEEGKLVMFEK